MVLVSLDMETEHKVLPKERSHQIKTTLIPWRSSHDFPASGQQVHNPRLRSFFLQALKGMTSYDRQL